MRKEEKEMNSICGGSRVCIMCHKDILDKKSVVRIKKKFGYGTMTVCTNCFNKLGEEDKKELLSR